MTDPAEKFINFVTNQPVTLTNLTGSNFGASGVNHSVGLVPDPGSSAGTTKFLREDGTWQTISTSSVLPTPIRVGDMIYWNGSAWVTLAGNNSGTQFLQETSAGVPSWVTLSFAPTYQSFTSGSANYTPTSASVVRIKVRMCGGGGGGGAQTTNAGSVGTDTSFGSWTAIHGNGGAQGGATPAGGAGGTGGANGTGTLITRLVGGQGQGGQNVSFAGGGSGSSNPFGGAGGGGASTVAGNAAAANTGSGGGGAGGNTGVPSAAGGGAGEYVEFVVSAPGTIAYSVGAGGNGGAAGGAAGGAGGSGIIIIEEFYS